MSLIWGERIAPAGYYDPPAEEHCPDCNSCRELFLEGNVERERCEDSHLHSLCSFHAEEAKAAEAEYWMDVYRDER